MKRIYIQPFTTEVDWTEIGCLMEVSAMFYICRYCVFTWDGRLPAFVSKEDFTRLKVVYGFSDRSLP